MLKGLEPKKLVPEGSTTNERLAVFKDLGLIEYRQALDIQMNTLQSRIEDVDLPECIYLLEHPSVFTLGKNGGVENLIVSDDFLAAENIDIVQTRRGGNITFHGPGQLVMYPVVNLEKNKIGLNDFVHGLEEIMIKTTQTLGIQTERNPKNHGIWVGNQKIGSVGLGIKKGICYHGIALNISMDLTPFSWVNPCGLHGVSMTSIQHELENSKTIFEKPGKHSSSKDISFVHSAKKSFKKHFCSVFSFKEMQ